MGKDADGPEPKKVRCPECGKVIEPGAPRWSNGVDLSESPPKLMGADYCSDECAGRAYSRRVPAVPHRSYDREWWGPSMPSRAAGALAGIACHRPYTGRIEAPAFAEMTEMDDE